MEITKKQKEKLNMYYFQITDLWKRLCEHHNTLLNLTCDEYTHLLSNEIEKLEEVIDSKKRCINHIGELENFRQDLITKYNNDFQAEPVITSVKELISIMQEVQIEKEQKHLLRFNKLLIDIIEKIQTQNKKNQLFINKAIQSLKEMREEALGEKTFPLYTSQGKHAQKIRGQREKR